MAYYKNNNYRKNGGYKKNNNYKYYENRNYEDNRPQERPVFNGFDATQYKKPDIEIKDLNGKVYTISGNFSTAFSAELIKTSKRIEKIRAGKDTLEQFPEMFDLLREWCLSLINLNVDGVEYTMEDVNRGFNDIYVLYNLVGYIAKVVGASNREININENYR